jgi:PAS domain S-box-containing protein
MAETIQDVFWISIPAEQRLLYVSPAYEQVWGRSREGVYANYQEWIEAIHQGDRARVQTNLQTLLETGEYDIEYRIVRPDGSIRWVRDRGFPIQEASGDIYRVTGIAEDITERKRAEAERQNLITLIDNSPDFIGIASLDGQGQYLNPAGRAMVGLDSLEQVQQTQVIDCFLPEDRAFVQEQILPFALRDGFWNGEYRFRNFQTGEAIAVDYNQFIIKDPQTGDPIGFATVSRDIRERQQAEKALRESENRFRAMADNAPVMIWVTDPSAYCTYLSKSWYEFSGQTAQTGLGFGWLDAIHPDDYENSKNIFLTANERHEAFRLEYRLRRNDGEYRFCINAASPWIGLDGQFKGYIGSVLDITERKQAEQALQQVASGVAASTGEAFFPAFVRHLATTFGVRYALATEVIGAARDRVRVIAFWADNQWRELFEYDLAGTPCEQVIAQGTQYYCPDNALELFPSAQNLIALAAVSYFGAPMMDEQGRVAGHIYVLDDKPLVITDAALAIFKIFSQRAQAELKRKQVEEALRESEYRLRLALESAELGTWDLNPITAELKWDNACKAMFGLSPDATVDFDVFLAGLHPDDRDRTGAAVEAALNPASNGEYDIEYRTVGIEDGVERWVAAKGKVVFNQAREAVRFIGTVLNITQKKRAEAEREQLLQREQAAREQAEVANRIKDEFLAVLSHELRTPLNPILGWSSLLQRNKLDAAKTTQALATIERNAKLQVQLIDDLLDISRILRGKLSLTVAPVDLSNVICAALETVRFAAEAKSLQIHLFSSSIGLVIGDAGRLQQAVWNLLSNAIKFTPAGGRVEVRLEVVNGFQQSIMNNYAQIQVIDTGKGIQPDFLPYVFEHFRQEDGATTRKFGGLGLGLAIVRQLVELHGGRVFASSPGEGQGSTFTIQIPLAAQSVEMPATASASASLSDLSGIRVLVVDDDVDSREFIAFVLEQENAIVTAVSSGIESLQAFAQSIPHIIVSDIGMPQMDGYMLMRQIRMLPPDRGGSVLAIALSAYAGELDRQQAIEAGFQRHIAKPINPNALVKIAIELVQQQELI